MTGPLNDQQIIARLAELGDWDGIDRHVADMARRARAEVEEHRRAVWQARRESPDRRQRALQAHLDGDPDWRSMMPLSWRASRWWSLHWLLVVAYALVAVGAAALTWWPL